MSADYKKHVLSKTSYFMNSSLVDSRARLVQSTVMCQSCLLRLFATCPYLLILCSLSVQAGHLSVQVLEGA
jgi:hypothetical protein